MRRIHRILPAVSLVGVLCPGLVPAYVLSACKPVLLASLKCQTSLQLRSAVPTNHQCTTIRGLGQLAAGPSHYGARYPSFGLETRRGMSSHAAGSAEPGAGRAVEVEKKFMLSEGAEERVAAVLPFKGEVSMTDEYLDAADFRLTTNDYWLRVRDGQVELKEPIAVKPGASEGMDRYTEITDPAAIVAALGGFFPGLKGAAGADLRAALGAEGCEAFCRIVSKRRKYGGGDGGRISVDLDVISEPSHINYNIGEVEVMAEDEAGVAEAEALVDAFLAQHQLASNQVALGKVLAVIKESSAEHWEALKQGLAHKYPKLNKV